MSNTNGERKRRSRPEWQRLIEACETSELSQAAFCREHGIALTTFQYWKRRLRNDRPLSARQPAGVVDLAQLHASPAEPGAAASGGWSLELLVGNWLSLRVSR